MPTPGLNERNDGLDAMSLANSAQEIRVGTLFATLAYGDWDLNDSTATAVEPGSFANQEDDGFDDNYRDFLTDDAAFTAANGRWNLLDASALGDHWTTAYDNAQAGRSASDDSEFAFTAGGLYHGFIDAPSPAEDQQHNGFGDSNALLLQQGSTLVLAFRGTDGKDGSLESGQTFNGDGAWYHYEAFRPLIEAALAYAADTGNGIDNIIVAGHSLGGLMADIFTGVDAKRFADLPNIAGHLKIISLASPGIVVDSFTDVNQGFLNNHDTSVVQVSGNDITLVNPSPYYISIAHNKDRVADSDNAEYGSPLDALLHGLNPINVLKQNEHFETGLKIFLPNLTNTAIDYHYSDLPDSGFGTHHNEGIYLHNVSALAASALSASFVSQKIIMGVGSYEHMKSDWLGVTVQDEAGRSLSGGNGAEFILGLEGDDKLLGAGGNDLLDGGRGEDTLNGGDGADKLSGGFGADRLQGGTGVDTANYFNSSTGVRVNLITNINTGGEAGGDTLFSIENVAGSNTRKDEITGNSADNQFNGNGGHDSLSGGSGDDKLFGGVGNDTLAGGADNDRLAGEDGNDRFVFAGNFGDDIITDFAAGAAADDVVSIAQSGFADVATLLTAMTDVGNAMLLTTAHGSIRFIGIADVSAFSLDDFVLA